MKSERGKLIFEKLVDGYFSKLPPGDSSAAQRRRFWKTMWQRRMFSINRGVSGASCVQSAAQFSGCQSSPSGLNSKASTPLLHSTTNGKPIFYNSPCKQRPF